MRNYLKLLRASQELTQKELAAKIGVSQQMYGFIENGQRQKSISLDLINKLANVFNVPVADLITEETKLQSTALQ